MPPAECRRALEPPFELISNVRLLAPAPGMVIQHMCIEPVFIFFICKTSDAPAATSDQKIRKKIKNISVYCSILQYTAVYCMYTAVYWTLRAFLHHIVFITRRAHKIHADTLSQAKPHDLRAGDLWLCALPGSSSWCRGLGPPPAPSRPGLVRGSRRQL